MGRGDKTIRPGEEPGSGMDLLPGADGEMDVDPELLSDIEQSENDTVTREEENDLLTSFNEYFLPVKEAKKELDEEINRDNKSGLSLLDLIGLNRGIALKNCERAAQMAENSEKDFTDLYFKIHYYFNALDKLYKEGFRFLVRYNCLRIERLVLPLMAQRSWDRLDTVTFKNGKNTVTLPAANLQCYFDQQTGALCFAGSEEVLRTEEEFQAESARLVPTVLKFVGDNPEMKKFDIQAQEFMPVFSWFVSERSPGHPYVFSRLAGSMVEESVDTYNVGRVENIQQLHFVLDIMTEKFKEAGKTDEMEMIFDVRQKLNAITAILAGEEQESKIDLLRALNDIPTHYGLQEKVRELVEKGLD